MLVRICVVLNFKEGGRIEVFWFATVVAEFVGFNVNLRKQNELTLRLTLGQAQLNYGE